MDELEKGRFWEKLLVEDLERKLDPSIYQIVPNVTLELMDGTTQIDVVIFSVYGIFVIEHKAYLGYIYGSEKQPKWTYVLNRNSKYGFQNPLLQNYRHIQALIESFGCRQECFKSVIVFREGCKFKTPLPENVLCGSPVDHVCSFQEPILSLQQVQECQSILKFMRLPESDETDLYHLHSLENRLSMKSKKRRPVTNARIQKTQGVRQSAPSDQTAALGRVHKGSLVATFVEAFFK